ncbi:MAG: VOC family protein, partial [Hyphomicrobiales bacterium]
MTTHGFFHWNELMTRDVDKARAFYTATVGWSYTEMPMEPGGIYAIAMMGDKPAGGMFEMKGKDFDGVPEAWMSYLAVDDIDARLEKAVAEGATVLRQPFDVPKVGRIAILKDGGGGVIGWMTPV